MAESPLLFERELPNGLRVELRDLSRHYFGGYWQVVLEVRCPVPVRSDLIDDSGACAEACRLLGENLPFVQRLERMAVRQDLLEPVRQELIRRFEDHLIPFLSHPRFAEGFLAAELEKRRRKTVRGIPAFS